VMEGEMTHVVIGAVGDRLLLEYFIIIIVFSHRVSRVGTPVLQTSAVIEVLGLIKEVKHRLDLSLGGTFIIKRHFTYVTTHTPQHNTYVITHTQQHNAR